MNRQGPRFRLSLLLALLPTSFALPAHGQLSRVPESAFSEAAVEVPLPIAQPGAALDSHFSAFGVRFSGEASVPRAEMVMVTIGIPGQIDGVVRNVPIEGSSSAGRALRIHFSRPVARVGLVLGNGSPETVAVVRALDGGGRSLGELEETPVDELRGPFLGLETSAAEGIVTLVVDYGPEENPEQINRLLIDYADNRPFRVLAPQVAAGSFAGLQISTTLRLTALFPGIGTSVTVSFFDTAGRPAAFNLNGMESDRLEFPLRPFQHVELKVAPVGEGAARTGFAVIASSSPLAADLLYETVTTVAPSSCEPDAAGGEAAITRLTAEAQPARTFAIFRVVRDPASRRDTGVAIVNASDQPNRVRLLPASDQPGGGIEGLVNMPVATLAPGEQLTFQVSELCSRFVNPLFTVCARDFVNEGDFSGTISVVSVLPVAVSAIETRSGLPVAGLPTGFFDGRPF